MKAYPCDVDSKDLVPIIKRILLSVIPLNCCVVVFLRELHAVDEITHVFGEHLVGHLHLPVGVGGEGGDESVHRRQ